MENKLFALHTAHTSYLMQADAQGRLLHLYYGPRTDTAPAIASPHNDPGCHPNLLPQEWPCPGIGDNHAPFFEPEFADGTAAAALKVVDSRRTPGLPTLPGLPAFWDGDETLTIVLEDAAGLRVELHYGVIAACDLLLRWATLTNTGSSPLTLRGVPSAVLDFRREDLDFLTLDGEWGAERTPHRAALRPGVQSVSSVCGLSSHFHNPFAVLCEPDADEEQGCCWGAALVYSGNFRIQAEQNRGSARLSLGVEPYHFAWTLAPGEQFTTPQAAFVFSDRGLGGMSRAFHGALLRGGALYRLALPTGKGAAWAIAAQDGSEAVVFAVGDVLDGRRLPLPFAPAGSAYRVQAAPAGEAATLCAADGLPLPVLTGTLPGAVFYLGQSRTIHG